MDILYLSIAHLNSNYCALNDITHPSSQPDAFIDEKASAFCRLLVYLFGKYWETRVPDLYFETLACDNRVWERILYMC